MNVIKTKNTKYKRKYKCKYCDIKYEREKLINHIDKNHSDLIPQDYTATRLVFNLINKKEYGTCVVCKSKTKWNEDKGRYERICESKVCHDKYVEYAHNNTKIVEKLNDPEFQKKMLANRSISGTYKFSDGGVLSYTGSYEKNLLEFMDKFMNIKSYDIMTPGPIVEYTYEGEKRKWITDLYYIPYNLAFDVKDGGSNPNKRNMPEYRAKQIAKERAIEELNKYNYIRLTDNNFQQLIDIFLELKYRLNDNQEVKDKMIIRINESNIAANALPPANSNDVYIIKYSKRKNMFVDEEEEKFALSKSYMQDAITINNDEYEYIDFESFFECTNIAMYRYKYSENINYLSILKEAKTDKDFYSILSKKECIDYNQIDYDNLFEKVMPYSEYIKFLNESINSTLINNIKNSINENTSLPYFELENLNKEYSNIKYYRDMNGVFLMNEETKARTKSFKDIDELKQYKNICNFIFK